MQEEENMKYEEFKEIIVEELKQHYGKDAVVEVRQLLKNHNQYHDGLQILLRKEEKISPIIYLNEIYEKYCRENMQINQCVEWILEVRNQEGQQQLIYEFAKQLREWNQVKEQVYPTLVPVKSNEAYVNQFVSTPFLDMAVIYRITYFNTDGSSYSVKVTQAILESYGITVEQLHEQAMENLKREKYQFTGIEQMIKQLMEVESNVKEIDTVPEMYIFTNKAGMFGTSGILDNNLLKQMVGDRNYFVMMPCMHEAVFLADDGEINKERLEETVRELLQDAIQEEEQLSTGYYYYNGATGKLSIG